jgi:hypothetical protein
MQGRPQQQQQQQQQVPTLLAPRYTLTCYTITAPETEKGGRARCSGPGLWNAARSPDCDSDSADSVARGRSHQMTFNGVMFTEAPQIKHTQFTKTSPISTNMAAKKSPLPQHVDQWKLHCARLTTAQLSSPDAMRDYITAFQSTIGGLDSTQLVGHDAATANVAGFLNKAPSVPSAGALRQLAEESRQLTDIATKASCNGVTKVPATPVSILVLVPQVKEGHGTL